MTKKFMQALSLGLLTLTLSAAGCKKAEAPVVPTPVSAPKVYQGHGKIMDFQEYGQVIVLKHDKIEGLMEGMTMGFELKDPALAKVFKRGDMVNFDLQVSDDNATVISLTKTAK
jgi:Cu/Ag efflux protein CusF